MSKALIRTETIPWQNVERHRRKGWMTRDFFINGIRYEWLSSGVSKVGIVRFGMKSDV